MKGVSYISTGINSLAINIALTSSASFIKIVDQLVSVSSSYSCYTQCTEMRTLVVAQRGGGVEGVVLQAVQGVVNNS